MTVDILLAVQRLRVQQHFGFIQQLDDSIETFAALIADLVQPVGMREFDEEIGEIPGDVLIRPAQRLDKAPFGQGAEQPP